MDKEQIKAIAEKADDYADNYLKSKGEYHPNWHDVRDEHFYHSAIESYEAELLADFGEPVAEFKRHPFGDYTELSFSAGYSARRGDKLYTSDQVAAAILKATGPLEDEVERLKSALTQFLDQEGNPPSDTGEWRYVLQVLGESK